MDEDGDAQAGPLDGFCYALLIAEVGECYDYAVNCLVVFGEQGCAFLRVVEGFDGAVFCVGGFECDGFVAGGLDDVEDVLTSLFGQRVGEESAVAYDDAKGDCFSSHDGLLSLNCSVDANRGFSVRGVEYVRC